MTGAKERDPEIRFAALPWSAAGYLGGGNFYSRDTINYHIAFAQCAEVNGTPLSYLGVWNETPYWIDGGPSYREWIVDLRHALDATQLSDIKLDVWDGDFDHVVADAALGPEFRQAVGAVGDHYGLWNWNTGLNSLSFSSPPTAEQFNRQYRIPLWQTEGGGLDWAPTGPSYWDGARFYAEQLLRYYVEGKNTAVWMVAALDGYYLAFEFASKDLPHPGNGMIEANTPWSGRYELLPADWAVAHVTQFTWPGWWRYLDSASCLIDNAGHGRCATSYLGPNQPGVEGSFVTLREVGGSNWTVVLQTEPGFQPRIYRFCAQPGTDLATPDEVNLWTSSQSAQFVPSTVTRRAACYDFPAQPDSIYTLTTMGNGHKGNYKPNSPTPFRLPYNEDFSEYRLGTTPRYLSDFNGTFQIGCNAHNPCLTQILPRSPIPWGSVGSQPNEAAGACCFAATYVGYLGAQGDPNNWCGYSARVDVRIDGSQGEPLYGQAGYAGLIARSVGGGIFSFSGNTDEYRFVLFGDDHWELQLPGETTISGTVGSAAGWHRLGLRFTGTSMTPTIDGTSVSAPITPTAQLPCGFAGLISGWNIADFDNLHVGN
jgi:hypothetical protein